MNLYKAFYKNKSIEVQADTQYAAQLKAAALFKAKKSWQVNVSLLELNGVPYFHTAVN